MNNIITLLKLEFKNKYGSVGGSGKSVAKVLVSLVFYAAIIAVLFFGAQTLFRMFDTAGMAYEALVFFYTLIFLFLLFTGISSTIKVLYYKGDNLILMRFPVKGSEIFISKTLFLFSSQLIMTATLVIPFMIAYGTVVEVNTYFYSMIPVVIVFLVFIPFFLSNLLAIPIMQLTNKIRNKYMLLLILMSLLIAGVFAAYMLIFSRIVEFLQDSSYSVFSDEVVVIIKGAVVYFYPTKFFADILTAHEQYYAYPVLIMLTAICLCGTILVIAKLYQRTLLSNVELEGSAFKHKTRNHKRTVFGTLLKKEFIQVFRSVNYSFQYFALACSMPVMVYFCNEIASQIGKNNIGDQINTGLTILVMMIFATVTASFSATSVTREGRNFYQTKTMPVSIHTQLFAKFIMYMVVSVGSNVICIVVLIATKMMDYQTALWVFGIVQCFSVALTLRSMKFDIKKPCFSLVGEGEVVNNNVNTTRSIGFGFVVAIVNGVVAMLIPYLFVAGVELIVCSVITGLITVYCVTVYFFKLKKSYGAIVNR